MTSGLPTIQKKSLQISLVKPLPPSTCLLCGGTRGERTIQPGRARACITSSSI
jgi:hypothetical protein